MVFRSRSGSWFSATVVRLSRDFEVTGRVRNLTDGRVELEAEGERPELVRFRDRIVLEMKRHITSQVEDWGPAAGQWATFDVAY